MIDLPSLAIAKIINDSDSDLFLSLNADLFQGQTKRVYKTIAALYNGEDIPSLNSVLLSIPEECPVVSWCTEYVDTDVDNDVIVNELNNNKARDQMLDYILEVTDAIPSLTAENLVETSINLTNILVDCAPITDDSVVDLLDVEVEEEQSKLYTTGLCQEFDNREGGFSTGELVLMGGIRGSGKSIITQNLTTFGYSEHEISSAYFNLEMSPTNLNRRFLSSITQTAYNLMKLKMTEAESMTLLRAKARFLYQNNEALQYTFDNAKTLKDLNIRLKNECQANDHKLTIINDGGLTMTKLEQHLMKLKDQCDLKLVGLDYLNIIKDSEKSSQDWLVQQKKSERLKELALRYDIILITPMQIHNDGSAKRAKAVEDAADRVFKFFPKINEQGNQGNLIDVYQAKARDNEAFPFQLKMDWHTLTLDSQYVGKADAEVQAGDGIRAA